MRRAVLFFTLVAGAIPAAAQPVVLSGRVTDTQGGVVVGADLRLLREDGASARRTVSGGAGEYRFDDVPVGTYILQAERPGFRRRADVVILANGSSASFAVELSIAGVDESIEVTASGVPRTASETSKALTVIDASEIRDRNEASFAEIVRYTPGVQVRDNGGPGQLSQMRIRGLRPDAAAVLIDGMRFRDAATTQGDVTSFLSNLNFVAWDRVEVLRGSGSSLHGTNAVGGAVNVVTREGGGPTTAEAQLEAGSLGWLRARGSIAGSAFANRLRFAAGGLQWNVTDGLDGNDAARSTGGQGMLHYQITPATSIAARVLASNDRVELNTSPTASGIPAANIGGGTIVDAIPVAREEIERFNEGLPFEIGEATYFPGRDDPDSRRESWFHATALWLRHAHSASLSFQASYQRVTTSRTFWSGPLGAGSQPPADAFSHPVGDIDTLDLRAVLTPSPWLTVTLGYELERERFRDRQDNNLPPPRAIQTATEVSQIGNAGFAAAQVGLLDRRLLISLSGRIQAFSMNPIDLSAVGTRNVYEEIELEAPPSALTGDVSAAYLIARSRTKLRAHLGNAYRAPALYERFGGGYSNDPVSGGILFTAFGDPRLEPDRYRAFDFGVEQYFWEDRLLASATYFDVDIDSMTVFDSAGRIRPESDPFGRSLGYLNGSGGFSRGLEVSLDARPAPALRLSASYTHTRAETEDDVTVPGFFLVPAVFEHTASLLVTNRWSTRLETTFDVFHGSEAYGSFFAAGRPRAYRYPAFTKAALVARYLLGTTGESPVRLYGKVDNLFDGTYYQGGWRAPGRMFVAGVSVGF